MTMSQMGQPQMGNHQMGHPSMVQSQPMVQQTQLPVQILAYLRNHSVPDGWQQTFRIEQRVAVIHQIITQLNLVRPMPIDDAFRVAREFEAKAFEKSPDQASYQTECRKKLTQLTQARQQTASQVHGMQNLQDNQRLAGQPPVQTNFMSSNQPNFQATWANQQNMPRLTPNNVMPMHQQQVQNPSQLPMGNMANTQQPFQNGQQRLNAQQPASNAVKPVFTDQDQAQIWNLMQQIMQTMSQDDKLRIHKAVAEMDPNMKQMLASRGMNPKMYMIRHQATQTFMQQRNLMAGQAAVQTPMPGGATGLPQAGPMIQPSQPIGQQPGHFDRTGNMNHILGQQQQALRHQQAGEVVVPANTGQRASSRVPQASQGVHQQGSFIPGGGLQLPISNDPSRPIQWPNSQGQTSGNQSSTQLHPQQAMSNFGNIHRPNIQQSSLMGQDGGLNNTAGLQTPHQNRAMPTLNQGMNPPTQTLNLASPTPGLASPSNGQRPVQNVPNGNQMPSTNSQHVAGGASNRPWQLAMPAAMQQYFQSLKSDEDRRQFLAAMKRRQAEIRQQAQLNGNQPMGPNGGIGQPAQRAPQAPMGNLPNVQGPKAQALLQNSMNAGQQRVLPQGINPQSDLRQRLGQGRTTLTEEQMREMDPQPFPNNLLNNNHTLSQLPTYVKTWGQLKDWVANNVHSLPEHSVEKLQLLQVKHYDMTRREPSQNLMQLNQNQANRPHVQGPGPAPPAQMFPPGGPQASMKQGTFPPLAQPTMQEMESMRARIPPNYKPRPSDDQLRSMIMKQKHEQRLKAIGNQQLNANTAQQTIQQQQYQNLLLSRQMQLNGSHEYQLGQGENQQGLQPNAQQRGQQIPRPSTNQQSRPNQAKGSGQMNQQGIKRINTDDVIEVPDPTLSQPPPARQPTAQMTPRSQGVSAPAISQAQLDAMPPQQRQQYERYRLTESQREHEMHQRSQSAQGQPPALSAARSSNQNHPLNLKIKQLRDEVMRSIGPRSSQPMNPMHRGQMIEELRKNAPLLNRVDDALPVFLAATSDESRVKEIIRAQALVVAQVRDSNYTPIDNFTTTVEELRQCLNTLGAYVQYVMRMVALKKQQAMQNQTNKVPQTPVVKTPQPQVQNQPQQLTPANLQQQQEALQRFRAASVPKNQGNKPPDAPTTTHAPFSFGSQSPQGIPQLYNPQKNELTQDKLVLPPTKKRKGNQRANASATPTQAQSNATPQKTPTTSKVILAESQGGNASPSIKCTVADCKSAAFTSKIQLDKHIKDAHEVKDEQITDPLDYVLVGLREVLNLDIHGKSKPSIPKSSPETLQGPIMKASVSSQNLAVVKKEGATPQPKASGQASQARTSVSTSAQDKKPQSTSTAQATPAMDAWATTKISKGWFQDVFKDVRDPNRQVSAEFLTEWLNSTNITSSSTPQSVDDKGSPQGGSMSADQEAGIEITEGETDDEKQSWLPAEWFENDPESLDMDGYIDVDWDMASIKDEDVLDRKTNENDPSDEWLKVWAPEKMDEKAKKQSFQKK